MSNEHSAHGASHDHIMPVRNYLMVASALFVLTVITVAVAQVDFGPWNLVVAMLVATTKAVLVAMFFMHLFYDNKLFAAFFTGSFVILGIFIIITMFDTMERDRLYPDVATPIREHAIIYDDQGMPLKKNAHAVEGEHGAAADHGEADATHEEGAEAGIEEPAKDEAAASGGH